MASTAVVVAALTSALDELARLDPASCADRELLAAIEALLVAESRVRAMQARWLRVLDARDATVAECGRATRSWLIEEASLGPAEASRRVTLARRLDSAPELADAFASGAVTAEHASVVVEALASVDDAQLRRTVEHELVELARTQPPLVVARAVDQIRGMLGVESSADEAYARRHAERHLSLASTFGGSGSLSATLTPEGYETLRVAVQAAAEPAGPEDERTPGQRRHDGLVDIARFYLSHAGLAPEAGERPRVVVTMPFDALADRLRDAWGAVDSGVALAPQTIRRLACDAEVIPAVLGTRGDVLDIGRTTRVFTTAIRRAAKLRDGGRCAYPRCRRPIAELHHIVPWASGGPTSLDNAAWLCSFHHWLVHEGRWTMRRSDDGRYVFARVDERHTKAA